MTYRAVVFDMDGVLADSEPAFFEAVNIALQPSGKQIAWNAYKRLLGTSVDLREVWSAVKHHRVILHPGVMDIRHVHRLVDDRDVPLRLHHSAYISRLSDLLDWNKRVSTRPDLIIAVHRSSES